MNRTDKQLVEDILSMEETLGRQLTEREIDLLFEEEDKISKIRPPVEYIDAKEDEESK